MNKFSKKTFLFWFVLIVLSALFMRLYKLDAKPLHHDEAVQQYFYIEPLLRDEALIYLGTEYHGLFPHFLSYPYIKLFGLSLFSLRFTAALFGAFTVMLLYFLKDYIGRVGTLFSAAFLAISPTFVYYSRQYTGYPFLTFFLLLFVIIGLRCQKPPVIDGRHAWQSPASHPIVMRRFLSMLRNFPQSKKPAFSHQFKTGGKFLTFLKEVKTYQLYSLLVLIAIILNIHELFFIFLFIVISFVYLNYLFDKNFLKRKLKPLKKIKKGHFIIAILASILVFIMIHTNFFFQPYNLTKLMSVHSDFSNKVISTAHNKSFPYYFTVLFPLELGLFLIGVIGLFHFRRNSYSIFIIFWSLFSLLIFSLISYKANWMLPMVIFPLILHFGNTIDYLAGKSNLRIIILIASIVLILISLFFSIQQNFIFYNDFEKNKIGYVETSPEINQLTYDIKEYAQNRQINILITAKSYWPLPYYLRAYNVSYFSEIDEINLTKYPDYEIYISNKNQVPLLPKSITKRQYLLRDNYPVVVLYKH